MITEHLKCLPSKHHKIICLLYILSGILYLVVCAQMDDKKELKKKSGRLLSRPLH